mmetsp:Transcript_23032/g.41990  ORF Transcript_23032/g.41990 Transcript_23032/m.41990 type:complete len:568 (+) Transcript_23032:142-1845(+)
MDGMEGMKAALAAKGYDLVGSAEGDGSDSDDCGMPGRIPSIEPNQAREKGNKAFAEKKYDKAIKYWQGGLKSILSALCSGPEAMQNTSLSELDLTLNLNIAMAYMKKGDFDAADRSVDKALARRDALPPHQITKALYRKASAQQAMARLEETLETLKDLLEVDPKNAAATKMQQEVDREWRRQCREQKENMKKLWGKMEEKDKKEGARLRQKRDQARQKSGVKWLPEGDLDTAAFERGEEPACDGKDWGLALSRTVLWSMEQLAVEGLPVLETATHATAWFLGVSSTCELRWLQPSVLLSRLPNLETLEVAMIGFLGELDPENKRVPDPKANSLPEGVVECGDRCLLRIIKSSLQDALTKQLKPVADAAAGVVAPTPTTSDDSTTASSADKAEKAGAADAAQEAAAADATPEPAAAASSGEAAAAEGREEEAIADAPQEGEAAANETEEEEPPGHPDVCFIAHPQLHRYFTDFYPAIYWLIRNRVPTIIIGASEPDPSWKQDEILLKALGCEILVSKRECPYPMCLPDNSNVRKCSHIVGFLGGKALERDKLTKTKIDLLAQDYSVR